MGRFALALSPFFSSARPPPASPLPFNPRPTTPPTPAAGLGAAIVVAWGVAAVVADAIAEAAVPGAVDGAGAPPAVGVRSASGSPGAFPLGLPSAHGATGAFGSPFAPLLS